MFNWFQILLMRLRKRVKVLRIFDINLLKVTLSIKSRILMHLAFWNILSSLLCNWFFNNIIICKRIRIYILTKLIKTVLGFGNTRECIIILSLVCVLIFLLDWWLWTSYELLDLFPSVSIDGSLICFF